MSAQVDVDMIADRVRFRDGGDLATMSRGYGRTLRTRNGHALLVWRERGTRDGFYALLFDGRVHGAPAGPERSAYDAIAAVGGL